MPEENLEIKQIQVGDNTYNVVDAGALRPADVVDNVTTETTNKPLSAKQGKVLQDQITNLKTIGRFLSILDSAQGTVSSQPSQTVGETYNYKVGDYYRIGAAGNYFPKATATYTVDDEYGHTNFETHEGETLGIGDVIYCSNISGTTSTWVKQADATGVTSVTAGTGLTGGTITSTGTIAVDTDTIATKTYVDGKLELGDVDLTLTSTSITDGTTTLDISNKQDKLPTTSTAGKVLKSTSTAGTVEWVAVNECLPLSAGSSKPLTGDLYFGNSSGPHISYNSTDNSIEFKF